MDFDEAVIVKLAYSTLLEDPVLLKNTFGGFFTLKPEIVISELPVMYTSVGRESELLAANAS